MASLIAVALAAQLTMTADPARVCVDPRTGYPNVDLVVANTSGEVRKIAEIRGMVLDVDGGVLERRLIWQDSLKATRPDVEVPARGEAVIFNAMRFNTAAPGRPLRFRRG